MSTVQIKHRVDGRVLFECEVSADIESAFAVRHALEKATTQRADLTGAYLTGADLRGAYLRGVYLTGADLRGVNLRGAYLRGVYLTGADLRGVNLRGAYLTGADLRGAYLRGAYLTGADLRGANLRGANLRGADLRGAYLTGADLRGANLRGANGESLHATDEQAIENLDKVRAIVLDDAKRLEMGHWHGDDEWKDRTCAEETICGTTHCLAGWLQVCSTNPELRKLDAELAGVFAAPVAAKMFFKKSSDVLPWLESRAYVVEIEEAIANRALAADVNGSAA